MLAKTHFTFGILAGILTFPLIGGNKIIFFGLVLLGALLPDIDHTDSKMSKNIPVVPKILQLITKHRGIFHSIFLAVGFSAILYLTLGKAFGLALFIGYTSHLIIDGFTKAGTNFLHPITKLHLSGPIETGTIAETVVLTGIIAIIVVILV